MTTRRALATGAAVLGLLLTTAVQAAGDPEAGRYKIQTCLGCHGIPGYSSAYPSFKIPKLGGQKPEYIVSALKAYKSGKREHDTMQAQASSLSVQDMRDIAAYIASLERESVNAGYAGGGDPAAGKALSDTCAACHGERGLAPNGIYPRLAGQHESYLFHALMDYKTGRRQSPIMSGMVAGLTQEQMHDLAAYYASQSKLFTLSIYGPE